MSKESTDIKVQTDAQQIELKENYQNRNVVEPLDISFTIRQRRVALIENIN